MTDSNYEVTEDVTYKFKKADLLLFIGEEREATEERDRPEHGRAWAEA